MFSMRTSRFIVIHLFSNYNGRRGRVTRFEKNIFFSSLNQYNKRLHDLFVSGTN